MKSSWGGVSLALRLRDALGARRIHSLCLSRLTRSLCAAVLRVRGRCGACDVSSESLRNYAEKEWCAMCNIQPSPKLFLQGEVRLRSRAADCFSEWLLLLEASGLDIHSIWIQVSRMSAYALDSTPQT